MLVIWCLAFATTLMVFDFFDSDHSRQEMEIWFAFEGSESPVAGIDAESSA